MIKTKTLFKNKLPKEFKRRVEIAVSTAEKIVKYDVKNISNKKLIISIQKSILDLLGEAIKSRTFLESCSFLVELLWSKKTEVKIKENLSVYILTFK